MTCFDKKSFWQCLYSKVLKAQTRHKYDSIEDFDKILAEIHTVENQTEISPAKNEKQAYCSPSFSSNPSSFRRIVKEYRFKIRLSLDSKLDDKLNKMLTKLDGTHFSQSHQ